MKCPECLEGAQLRLDGDILADRSVLDRHLEECAECRSRHGAVQQLIEGLLLLPRPVPPAGLSQRIAGRVLAERRAAVGFRRRMAIGAAIAASLLLMSLAAYQIFQSDNNETPDDSRLVKKTGPKARDKKPPVKKNHKPAVPDEDSSLDEDLSEAGTVAFALTRKAADQTVARAQQWLPRTGSLNLSFGPLQGGDSLAPVLDPLTQTFRQARDTFSTGIQPITTSAPRAWHTCTDFVDMFLQGG